MGKIFNGQRTGRLLASMGNSSADAFTAITAAACVHYDCENCIAEGEIGDDYIIDEDGFVRLVEKYADEPVDLLLGWAQFAMGIVELIGTSINASVLQCPFPQVELRPRFYGVSSPKINSSVSKSGNGGVPLGTLKFVMLGGEEIGYMDKGRALLFIKIAVLYFQNGASQCPLALKDATWCEVNGPTFCDFTEFLLRSPHEFFWSWAQYAAGLYETIKGASYVWDWDPSRSPTLTFTPVRQWEYFNGIKRNIVIGSRIAALKEKSGDGL